MENRMPFRRLGTMLDCSRNGVMTVDTLKRWVDTIHELGFNTLLVYTEDTYEVEGEPYFGNGRGRYSIEELKEIDSYTASKDMEFIPCIQTLAHLNALVESPAYGHLADCNDILLVGDERVYELIDKMFATLSKNLRTKHINIGMDEAHMIGRGRYYDMHGDSNRTEILTQHVKRVGDIAKKYGLTISMWGDMFFRLASGGNYEDVDFCVSEDVKKRIPENVELVYWVYHRFEKDFYKGMLRAHNRIKPNSWFAGGIWTWSGFSPLNRVSINASKAALDACVEEGIKDVFFTMWGDDTAECSKFASLPALFYVSEYAKGNKDEKSIKEKFMNKYGISFDRFMLTELDACEKDRTNVSKYVLYNDLFNGRCDSLICDGTGKEFKALSRKLAPLQNDEKWGYIFRNLKALCDVVSLKAEMGIRIRSAYNAKDKEEMVRIIADCKKLIKYMKKFYETFRTQWFTENKGHGFDVQDIRLGGMICRVEHCTKRLEDYAMGRIPAIEELELPVLDYYGKGTDYEQGKHYINSFKRTFTANVLTW